MRKQSILFFLLISLSLWSQKKPIVLDMESAIAYGLENNPAIQNANLEIRKAYKERWATIAIGLPQISLSGSYQNFLELPVSLVPAQFFGGAEGEFAELQFGTTQNMIGSVQVSQLLFNGSYLVGLKASKVFLTISELGLEKTNLEVRKAIIDAYGTVLLARENVSILKKNKANLERTLEETQKIVANGFAEEENAEQLQLTLSRLDSQLNYATNLKEITTAMLKWVLGMPESDSLQLNQSLEELAALKMMENKSTPPFTIDNNVDLKFAENEKESEWLLYQNEKAKSMPVLSAFINGTYTGNSNDFTFTETNQKWFGSSLFGINLQIPVFSSFLRAAKTQKAKLAVEQAETRLSDTRNRLVLELQMAENEMTLALKNYLTTKEDLALAERIEQKNKLKFLEGMSSSFDLRQAQQQLYTTQSQYLQSMKAVIDARTTLETISNTPIQ
ncbi:MAG: TolC family protein [Flavobacteriaceae bacterium]